MSRTKLLLSACCAVVLTAPHGLSQPPAQKPPDVDRGKKKIELPARALVAETAPAPRPVAPAEPDNPPVEPGKVKWHKSFADAKTAAEKSGKPILLFQMMGRLDQQFT
jgi:hypothetical protein